jgi:hypothetical protein
MKAAEFKIAITQLKNNLRGITLQLITSNSVKPFHTLKEFGNAILNEESKGNSFSVNQAWTTEGIITITSINQLSRLFISKKVTGIQFKTFAETSDFADYLKTTWGTTE